MVYEPEKLSKKVLRIVENADSDLFLSAASIWEIIIKYNLGKLNLHISPEKMISESLVATNWRSVWVIHLDLSDFLNIIKIHLIVSWFVNLTMKRWRFSQRIRLSLNTKWMLFGEKPSLLRQGIRRAWSALADGSECGPRSTPGRFLIQGLVGVRIRGAPHD